MLAAVCASLPDWLNHIHVLGVDFSIASFLNSYGYFVVALFIGIESTGIPFPGETMLLAASVYAAQGCGLQIPYVIMACAVGSIMGDNLGFWVGRTGGRNLIRKYGHYIHVNEKHLAHAERYFERYGGATVFFGRFLAILRAWAAFLAGVNRMPPLRFFIYNCAGSVLWSTTFGILGFALGKHLDQLQSIVSSLGLLGSVIVVGVVLTLSITIWRRTRQHGTATEGTEPATVASSAEPVPPEAATTTTDTLVTAAPREVQDGHSRPLPKA